MEEKETITLNYKLYPSGRKELCSVHVSRKELSLKRLDILLLEEKPLSARLSVGEFKLTGNNGESVSNDSGNYSLVYEKVQN